MNRVALRFAPLLVTTSIVVGGIALLSGESDAQLENQIFTSRADRLRLVVPRGWRATDQPSYPGLLLWLGRTQPPGQMALTAEPFTRELYCSWPIACRASQLTLVEKYACALRTKLESQRMRLQGAPALTVDAVAPPSVTFEYEDGRRFLRQAVMLSDDRAITLILSAPSTEARAAHARQFDQTLRTIRILTEEEASATTIALDGGVAAASDGGLVDASQLPTDGALLDAGVVFQTPTPTPSPVGPCPRR